MLVGTDVCVRVIFLWEKTGVPSGNPAPARLGDHLTISVSYLRLYLPSL